MDGNAFPPTTPLLVNASNRALGRARSLWASNLQCLQKDRAWRLSKKLKQEQHSNNTMKTSASLPRAMPLPSQHHSLPPTHRQALNLAQLDCAVGIPIWAMPRSLGGGHDSTLQIGRQSREKSLNQVTQRLKAPQVVP